MSRRRERWEQFVDSRGGGGSFSTDLIFSAHSLLQMALYERKSPVFRQVTNHYSSNATGVIVLVATALDTWVTEYTLAAAFRMPELRELADKPVSEKYGSFFRLASTSPRFENELSLLLDLRHEIVHFLPREFEERQVLPNWLKPLDDRGLMIKVSDPDFSMFQKLGSYALAYWAWEVACNVAKDLVRVMPHDAVQYPKHTAQNFACFRTVTAPRDLPAFDKRYELDLTDGGA